MADYDLAIIGGGLNGVSVARGRCPTRRHGDEAFGRELIADGADPVARSTRFTG